MMIPKPHPLDKLVGAPIENTMHQPHVKDKHSPFSVYIGDQLKELGLTPINKERRLAALELEFPGKVSRETLWKGNKADHPAAVLKALTLELMQTQIKPSSMVIFTDGSVTKKFEKAGAAALLQYKGEYFDSVAKSNSSASSTEAELIAVLLALHKCNNLQLAQADFDHLIIYR